MRDVVGVAEHKLETVRPWRQIDCCFSLAAAKMPMVVVRRDGVVELLALQFGIDQQVMMAGMIGAIHACRRDAHARQAEPHGNRA